VNEEEPEAEMDDDGGATMVQSMEGKELANAKSNW